MPGAWRFGEAAAPLYRGDAGDYRRASPASAAADVRRSGGPSGIDVRKVVETAIASWINTGIAHCQAGVGQVGAGVVQTPLACFVQALEAFATAYL